MTYCRSVVYILCSFVFLFFKQKTAYEMRISDWSSDVCSSDLHGIFARRIGGTMGLQRNRKEAFDLVGIGAEQVLVDQATGGFLAEGADNAGRSEERRVGKECVSTCRSRWLPYP